MKRLLFALLAICLSCSAFSQTGRKLDSLRTNGKFIISNDGARFDSKNQIVYNSDKDTVYVAFGNSQFIRLKADVKESITRNTISNRIQADKKIFVQIQGGKNGSDFETNDAQYLVEQEKGGSKENAYVIISKDDMPFSINIDGKVINVIEFTASDILHCETIRNRVSAYKKLPGCHKDTISIKKIDDYTLQEITLNPSDAWETSIKYYINEQECKIVDGKICFPSESLRSIKPGNELIVSYKIECKHDYFGHSREGELLKLYVKPSNLSFLWWFLLLVPIIGIVVWYYWPNREKSNGDIENQPLNNNAEINNELIENGNGNDAPVANENGITTVDDVLGTLLPNINSDLSTQEKIELIKAKILLTDKKDDILSKFYQELNLSDNSTPDDFLQKLNELKKQVDDLQSELQKCPNPEELYGNIITLLLHKDSKILSSLVDKAKQDCKGASQTNYDILRKFINILPMSLKESEKSNNTAQGIDFDITEQQMSTATNRRKMMVWMIEQLESRGYKELNRNGSIDDNFKKMSQALLSASEIEEKPSIDDIINTAVINDQFTIEQKNILLRRIIDQINSQIKDETALINSSISIDDFISVVSEKIQLPNSYEDAQEIIRKNNLKIINDILESDLDVLTQHSLDDALKSAFVKLLIRHLNEFQVENLEDAIRTLSIALENSSVLTNALKEYGINTISELPMVIRQKMSEEIISSVSQKVKVFFPDKHFDSIQKLVNSLLKSSEEMKDNETLIADELEEKISMRNNSYVSTGQNSIINLLNEYNELVIANEEQLNTEIREKSEHITYLESKVESKQEEVNVLTQKNTILMVESEYMMEKLRNGAEKIIDSCKTILHPCSDNDESQCVDIEDRLFADLLHSINRIKALQISNESIPINSRKAIQNILIQELSVENSPINTVCRYYAYSRLPFMTDTSREYGITFNRKNMAELFNAVETLYVQFGINLNIPDLFVTGFKEGNFENLTGHTYGDLDNLCQNSRNHFDNIDSKIKPSNVIVDVINVGYTVDGIIGRITSVLTY